VIVACPPSRVPSASRPQGTPARWWLILSALAVSLGLLGMHTLLTGHHSSPSSHLPTAVTSDLTDAHTHATHPAHAGASLAGSISGCSENCEATGAALCMAVITSLVLVWLSRRRRRAYGPPRRFEAGPGPGPTTKVVPRPPLRLLLCVDRT